MKQQPFSAISLLVFVIYGSCVGDIRETLKLNPLYEPEDDNYRNQYPILNIVNENSVVSHETNRRSKVEESRNSIEDSDLSIDSRSSGAHRAIKRIRKSYGNDEVPDPNLIQRIVLEQAEENARLAEDRYRQQWREDLAELRRQQEDYRQWRGEEDHIEDAQDREIIRTGNNATIAAARERINIRQTWWATYREHFAEQNRLAEVAARNELARLGRVRAAAVARLALYLPAVNFQQHPIVHMGL